MVGVLDDRMADGVRPDIVSDNGIGREKNALKMGYVSVARRRMPMWNAVKGAVCIRGLKV